MNTYLIGALAANRSDTGGEPCSNGESRRAGCVKCRELVGLVRKGRDNFGVSP
ncbi:MAG TPA: hypothetical protein VE870_00010 [Bacteroidales bacterium]|nr:hypothetical protein [Bacteroidales bacterium]